MTMTHRNPLFRSAVDALSDAGYINHPYGADRMTAFRFGQYDGQKLHVMLLDAVADAGDVCQQLGTCPDDHEPTLMVWSGGLTDDDEAALVGAGITVWRLERHVDA